MLLEQIATYFVLLPPVVVLVTKLADKLPLSWPMVGMALLALLGLVGFSWLVTFGIDYISPPNHLYLNDFFSVIWSFAIIFYIQGLEDKGNQPRKPLSVGVALLILIAPFVLVALLVLIYAWVYGADSLGGFGIRF